MQTYAKAAKFVHENHFSLAKAVLVGDCPVKCVFLIFVINRDVIMLIHIFSILIIQTYKLPDCFGIYICTQYLNRAIVFESDIPAIIPTVRSFPSKFNYSHCYLILSMS